MINNLVVKDKQEFMGVRIPVIEGGFGKGQKVILAKTVAEIHRVETKYINKIINNNITRFNENDLMDIKGSLEEPLNLEFTAREKANYKNIFILSQRGYTKLVAMMDNDNNKKWEVMNDLIDEYFSMKETLKNGQSLAIQQEIIEELKEAKSYYKIQPKTVHEFTDYIKKRLNINKANNEFEQVKIMVFARLQINKWADINLSERKSVFELIDNCVTKVKKERPYEQLSCFS